MVSAELTQRNTGHSETDLCFLSLVVLELTP